jgi:hypothetical protein
LEKLQLGSGRLIVRGQTQVGITGGIGMSSVTINAVELREGATRLRGLSLRLTDGARVEREGTAFVDRDELDALIGAVEALAKTDSSVTPLKSYEVTYRTRGGLEVTAFNRDSGARNVAVSAGRGLKATVFLEADYLVDRFVSQLKEGRATVDALK